MTVPAVMFIEAAQDMLKAMSESQRNAQFKELLSFGDTRAQAIGATGVSVDFELGYMLGLETMRALIATTPNPHAL